MNRHKRSPARVLVVDDEKPNVALLVRLLTAEGCEVCTAFDGESALAAIEDHNPDVILLDVQLRGLDGFELCRRVKQSPETRLVPVAFEELGRDVSNGARRHDLVRAFVALARSGRLQQQSAALSINASVTSRPELMFLEHHRVLREISE